MNWNNAEDVTFQITVGQLIVPSPLPKEDIHVTVCVGDMSKITCPGNLSEDHLMITWNHPFLFSAPLSMSVKITIYILPKELSMEWDKQPLGNQIISDVISLLESGNRIQFSVYGLSVGPATLSMTFEVSDVVTVLDEHDCQSALETYSTKLYNFGTQFKSVPCTSTKVEVDLARLDICPLGHIDHLIVLGDLSTSLSIRYRQQGNVIDLNRAMEIGQTRLNLCPLGHPNHGAVLGDHSIDLWFYYCIQKKQEDLDRIVEIQERWLDLCPQGDSDHSRALGSLALSLWESYNMWGYISDLNRSIEMGEKWLDLYPPDYTGYDQTLNNLALAINARYRCQGDLADLNRAIKLQEECLELRPPGHWEHGLALRNLALSLWDRFYKTTDHSDLTMAIKLFKKALHTYPIEHLEYAHNAQSIATTTLLSWKSAQTCHPSGQTHASADEAFQTYQLLKKCGPAVSLYLLEGLEEWVENAEKYNHSSALDAYQTMLNSLDQFTSLTSSLDSRHMTMQARVADLPNNAFSCATRYNDFQMAIELLEQGRGILWNQLARCDISIAMLVNAGNQGHELGRKFMRLSADLRKHAERGGDDIKPYWRVQEEWQSVVDKIRRLDGFSRFLLPPCFEELQHAAEHGPVIIVNASQYTCDAIIVLRARVPVHVTLPCSFADVEQLYLQLSELTQDAYAYGNHRESWVRQTLRDLWSSVVEPIASVLQNDIQLPPGSRVWWCPTSKFTTLPLHAAGPHRKAEKNFFDIYVSSYAPSLSALLRACDRIRSQRAARNAAGEGNLISFAAVGQGRPSADTKLGELPEVEHEIQRIRNETGMPPNMVFDVVTDGAATIEGAVQAFRDHRWVHVACHGAQHAENPFDSWFAMGDGKLTLMRIIQERYTNSELAFLSACHTAVGDASTPDEVLHLAAGMQFAGFNGVIGTLWRVDDAVAHQVVTRFYKEMFRRPDICFEHAAAALNTAVVETANEVSLEKRIVFVHIGI